MVKIKSTLEANIFDGVLIKKGINILSESEAEIIFNNYTVKDLLKKGYLRVIDLKDVKAKEEKKTEQKTKQKEEKKDDKKPDFASMDYNDLKKYVKENNIQVESLKKEDILKALYQ